ncbi:Gamma-interferon-inducible lysosomal thiol reductase [Thalictrum thalictroides]|uniref:Gamma-interferon-inducible lysosomal thiol reductase n=1 Tax=Thalictrum thalictroides TaxID=46969 RepID=A0A7J6UTY9_THATH|nr:Gamma-interferon-inducible lysosomal thiol reductase [Thalictrum thalictroides]
MGSSSSPLLFDLVFMLVIFSSSTSVSPQKVELALYYETLCPYCSNFMVNYLPEIFKNGLIDVIDLKLIPYGNAKLASDDTITCQHGQYECLLNTVEACVLHVWPDLKKQYSFIYCVERLVYEHKPTEWESCFAKTGFDSKPIEDCYKSGLGKQLDLQYAKVTNNLQPPHKYVPWVTVNGQPLYDDYENFITYVCKAYKGNPVPKACKDLPLPIVSAVKDHQIKQVCYAEETISSSETGATNIKPVASWRRQMMATSA